MQSVVINNYYCLLLPGRHWKVYTEGAWPVGRAYLKPGEPIRTK